MDHRIVYIGAQLVFAILFLTLLALQRLDHRNEKFGKLEILYLLFFVTSVLDGLWILIDGVPKFRSLHILLQIVYLSAMAFTGYTWFLYTLDFFPAKSMRLGKYKLLLAVPVLIQLILILTSVSTGLVFTVGADGVYTRGSLHMYSILMHFTYMILGSIVALRCRKEATLNMDKRRFTAAALFPVPTIVLAAAQILLPPGLPTMQGGVLIGFLLFYGTSQNLLVTRDYLTGLPNRVAFEMELMDELQKHDVSSSDHLYLIEGDLDRFKHINDTYGHPAGDEALIKVAGALTAFFSKYGAAVFRTGGDEFMTIIASESDISAHALQKALNSELSAIKGPDDMALSMSLGASEYDTGIDSHKLIDTADKALYAAKRSVGSDAR